MLDSVTGALLQRGYDLLDKGLIPDFILRIVIRALCRQRLRETDHGSVQANFDAKMKWIEDSRRRESIADVPQKANEQHYEVSTEFITSCLGPMAKYSSCLYPTGKESLADAERLMMEMYCQKAKLQNGQYVLDLGCGWGSLSLYLAKKYPQSRIVGLSNSSTQKAFIDAEAKIRGLSNVKIITADVNTFDFDADCERFDRVLSIEMFEHMKNYELLLRKISTWMKPSKAEDSDPALLFVHIFCHKTVTYDFEESDGWMAQTFFSGGTMPSLDLFAYFQKDLTLVHSSYLPGTHYSRTLLAWLKLQDTRGSAGIADLEQDAEKKGLPREEGRKAWYRFRVFYIACAELFGMDHGQEWGVGHYVFQQKS
ncbi:S-adenosyl-L-methionine-dependent methyltransferase [Auriscalpium vulgare]|uniref:S-adenosyl-L-methionine-dependent methyltransferase n=1 Tax=Auriscalpium vulgare TaxID=40419 RepID=A0ACB8RJZ7_9AGAM|nr:S-adenosyl-L-methionine-dependent methyltransferase [Auriscalpium vulgare]